VHELHQNCLFPKARAKHQTIIIIILFCLVIILFWWGLSNFEKKILHSKNGFKRFCAIRAMDKKIKQVLNLLCRSCVWL